VADRATRSREEAARGDDGQQSDGAESGVAARETVAQELKRAVREAALETLGPAARQATRSAAKYAVSKGPELVMKNVMPAVLRAGGPGGLAGRLRRKSHWASTTKSRRPLKRRPRPTRAANTRSPTPRLRGSRARGRDTTPAARKTPEPAHAMADPLGSGVPRPPRREIPNHTATRSRESHEAQRERSDSRDSGLHAPLRWLRRKLSGLVRWVAQPLRAPLRPIARLLLPRWVTKHVPAPLRWLVRLIAPGRERGFGFWWLVATLGVAVALGMVVALLLTPVAGLIALLVVAIWALVRHHRHTRDDRDNRGPGRPNNRRFGTPDRTAAQALDAAAAG
jgi:hypothetical protein